MPHSPTRSASGNPVPIRGSRLIGVIAALAMAFTSMATTALATPKEPGSNPSEASSHTGSVIGRLVGIDDGWDGDETLNVALLDTASEAAKSLEKWSERQAQLEADERVHDLDPLELAPASKIADAVTLTGIHEDGTFEFGRVLEGTYRVVIVVHAETEPAEDRWYPYTGDLATLESVVVTDGREASLGEITVAAPFNQQSSAVDDSVASTPGTILDDPDVGAQSPHTTAEPLVRTLHVNESVTGSISGHVTVGPEILRDKVHVSVYTADYVQMGEAVTDKDGDFTVSGLPAGTYVLFYYSHGLMQQHWYGNSPSNEWYGGMTYPPSASLIELGAGAHIENIDTTLVAKNTISGRISVPEGASLDDLQVQVSTTDNYGRGVGGGQIDSSGNYVVACSNNVSCLVRLTSTGGLIPTQWYADATSMNTATPVSVEKGWNVSGYDMTMKTYGKISGRVSINGSVGIEEASTQVEITSTDGRWTNTQSVANDGSFAFPSLAEGSYVLRFSSAEWMFDELWYTDSGSPSSATPIDVSWGETVDNIEVTIQAYASLSGRVEVSDPSVLAAGDVRVYAYNALGSLLAWAPINDDGTYRVRVRGREPVTLSFISSSGLLENQWYKNAQNIEHATQIQVLPAQDISDLNIRMTAFGAISGTVSAEGDIPLSSIYVSAESASGNIVGGASVGADGTYKIDRLLPGEYRVYFHGGDNSSGQWFAGAVDIEDATIVVVAEGMTTTKINGTVVQGGEIEGTVTVPPWVSLARSTIHVNVYDLAENIVVSMKVDTNGKYRTQRLRPGSYKVEFAPYNDQSLAPQWFEGKSDFHSATRVEVKSAETTSGIDARLVNRGEVTGKVTLPEGTSGGNIRVHLLDLDGLSAGSTWVDSSGHYRIKNVPAGDYSVQFLQDGFSPYFAQQWYNGVTDPESAELITVEDDRTTSGIDATLQVGGTISGVITAPKGWGGNCSVYPVAYDLSGRRISTANGRGAGSYRISGLATGTYRVHFSVSCSNGHLSSLWYGGSTGLVGAKDVHVVAGQDTPNVGVSLPRAGSIRGKIRVPAGVSMADGGVSIQIYDTEGNMVPQYADFYRDEYWIDGLSEGSYRIRASLSSEGNDYSTWFEGQSTHTAATDIVVRPGEETTGINLELVKDDAPPEDLMGLPGITGDGWVGEPLTAVYGEWIPMPHPYTAKWLRDGSPIVGATGRQYTPTAQDVGHVIAVELTRTEEGSPLVIRTSSGIKIKTRPPVDPPVELSVRRLSGQNRYETNVAVNASSNSSGPVFVATGTGFADALSIGPAVAVTEGTLYLTPSTSIQQQTLSAIAARKPSKIYVVGGAGAVSDGVVESLRRATGITPKRVGGSDRYETSARIFTEFFSSREVNSAFIATGVNYPDALSAAAAGGALSAPVLLVNGASGSGLHPQMSTLLKQKGTRTLLIAGGTGAVNQTIETNLGRSGYTVTRLAGANRYSTNAAVNDFVSSKAGGEALSGVWIATGTSFPDALSAAVPAGKKSQRLVLSPKTCVPKPVVSSWIKGKNSVVSTVSIVGGTGVLSTEVQKLSQCK